MIGLSLLDALLSRVRVTTAPPDAATIDMIGSWLDQMVDSLLGDIKFLRHMDSEFGTGDEAFDRVAFGLLYADFERWSHQADAVLKRATWLKQRGRVVAKAAELNTFHGLTLARLQVTLDGLDEADAEFARGECYTHEEIRDELRAKLDSESSSGVRRTGPVATGGDAGRDRAAG
jgi:hypothetical protein